MSSDAVQITIPDFYDEDDANSTPVFGRTGAGGLWGGFSSGQESPTASTPVVERGERSFFHSRGDSITSDDSSHSVHHTTRKFKAPFAHSAQSSVATNPSTSPFTKKTSFASLRNAFKSAKSPEVAPPVPQIDHQVYPALRNPFNRSTSSLAQHLPSRPSIHASPPNLRPSTPASAESKSRGHSKAARHGYSKSQHSHSESIFHSSDPGSDHGHNASYLPSLSPPPVPRVPSAFGGYSSREDLAIDEDKIIVDARTPSDFALHAIFIRFAACAEQFIDDYVQQPLDREPSLESSMGPGVDARFDDLLQSLGKIAQKHAKPVVDSVMRWRKSQTDGNIYEQKRFQARSTRMHEAFLTDRRSIASVYVMCRALVASTQSLSKDALPEAVGNRLEELAFNQFRQPDVKALTQSSNQRANADLFATLLGNLAKVRFESVTDRFLSEFAPVSSGQVPKDADLKYEYLVKGLRKIELKVWPPESFEEAAEFMEALSKTFENAHGNRLKTAFAESLLHLMYSVAKTAQAEVNHPQWAKAIEIIYPKAQAMANKPRYWHIAYPLCIIALCVAPRDYFQRNWNACVEAGLAKLKDKPCRIPVLNGILRLVWTYLYRCHEPGTTVTTKMEALMRHFFPPNRSTVVPSEDRVELFGYIVHCILSRQLDYGSELCLELLQERNAKPLQSSALNLAPERMAIAVQAILLSLRLLETEEPTPSWPSNPDFSQLPSSEDFQSSSEHLDPATLKPGWSDLLERTAAVITALATTCYQSAGKMSVLDEQYSSTRVNLSYEEAHNYVIRQHPEGSVAYSIQHGPQITVLQMCFRSWPRCLHTSTPFETVCEMLLRGIMHVEPCINEAASAALDRCTANFSHCSIMLSQFYAVVFDPSAIANEGTGLKLILESSRILTAWLSVLTKWSQQIIARSRDTLTGVEMDTISLGIANSEAASLFMLSYTKRSVYSAGVKTVRLLGKLRAHVEPEPSSPTMTPASQQVSIIDALLGKAPRIYMNDRNDVLDAEELTRLEEWRKSDQADAALRMAESDDIIDRALWKHIFPTLVQSFADHGSQSLLGFREKLVASVIRYHSSIVQLSGIAAKPAATGPSRSLSIGEKDGGKLLSEHRHYVQQWHMWVKLICSTAQVDARAPPLSARDHARARSELSVDKESFTTSRELFKYLSPFLDSDSAVFRDAAASCISSLPPAGYSYLLEDLSLLSSRQLYDDARAKGVSTSVGRIRRNERFQSAVASIYYLTAHMLPQQRSSGKQTALTHILKYVRTTQAFLSAPENRDLFSLQRLRRFFCGALERFFDGLSTINNVDRFIPAGMHLSLYRLCEEWCQLGKQSEVVKKRLVFMQTAAARSYQDPTAQAELIQRFQTETRALSNAAVGAMSSLVQKAYFPPEISATGSPTDKPSPEQARALDPSQTLDRIVAILASYNEPVQDCGKKALRTLLMHNPYDPAFSDEVLRRAFVATRDLSNSNARFFEVVADVICTSEHGFTFSQVVCLGLSNLCHPLLEIRRQAFNMLDAIHEQSSGLLSISQHEAAVCSLAPSNYLHAHRLISDILSGEHPSRAVAVLVQFAGWIPRVYDGRTDTGPLVLLQSLEAWVPSVKLMAHDRSGLTRDGRTAVYHLIALTLRYAEIYAEQVLVLWKGLVEIPSNGHAVVRFLLEESQKVGSAAFISCAAKVVACLCHSAIGRQLFEELVGVIEPPRMLPTYDHKLKPPGEEDMELWSNLDILFSDKPRLTLGMAQYALLFLSECALERYWELQDQLPILLHALFMHIDHRHTFVQQQCLHMLFQLLRSCLSGYDELVDRSSYPSRSTLKAALAHLQESVAERIWKDDERGSQAEPKMRWLCSEVLGFLEPIFPTLAESWAPLALYWSTSVAIRPFAFRSLQLYRALSPNIDQNGFDALLGRLSNTVAEEDNSMETFTVELIVTFTVLVSSADLDMALLPQMFWCAVACLSTTVEEEFLRVLKFLQALLSRLDLDDPHTADTLLSERPPAWRGAACVQIPLLTGLRSSKTANETVKLLQQLSKVADNRLIDPSEGRVRDLYTISLPWCLRAMNDDTQDEALEELAMNIGRLADEEERPSITRIMTSFAKRRFRTKDDFLRQSVASLREHYGTDHWADVVTLLVGLVLNKEHWIRVNTLQILQVLFQQRETKTSVDVMGSELLMPLLRLLETDLAAKALEVLDEPMQISGGPAAKHVLRMSLHHHLAADVNEVEAVAEIFGIPQESGWCVPRSSARREACRANVRAVYELHKATSRLSAVTFRPDNLAALTEEPMDDNLGSLVQNLHELSSFFQEEPRVAPIAHRQLEARVAAILAKSNEPGMEPQTPFNDIFDVGGLTPSEVSDDSSSDDTESDLFEFDSPSATRF
ncbi:cell morphogenesis N-terminal-domain-containing protein [Cytidiella melzeri]|nr:cell morphogenesis N-terminal-domain-containing protein [Cytidiella melzeri]